MSRPARMPRPLVIGHRGHGEGVLENSLASIEMARRAGADAVEIDIRSCAGGEIVVMHDPHLERITEGRDHRLVAQLTMQQLSAASPHIHDLEETLERCRQLDLFVNVELKRDVPDRRLLVDRAARILRSASHVWVSSFDPLMLGHLASLCPNTPLALLVHHDGWRRGMRFFAKTLGAWAIHPHHSLVTAGRVRRWQGRGLAVHPWTVNEGPALERLLDAGVDGIITDEPARLRALVTDRKRRPDARRRA